LLPDTQRVSAGRRPPQSGHGAISHSTKENVSMAELLVLYHPPEDPSVFDEHYASVHIPLAKNIPGLRDYRISDGPVSTPDGQSPYRLVASLSFDSLDAIKAGLSSKEGGEAVADLGTFATGGATILMYETKSV